MALLYDNIEKNPQTCLVTFQLKALYIYIYTHKHFPSFPQNRSPYTNIDHFVLW